MERINLALEDGTSELLTRLAGSERKRGEWISTVARAHAQNQEIAGDGATLRLLQAAMLGLAASQNMMTASQNMLEARVGKLEGKQCQ